MSIWAAVPVRSLWGSKRRLAPLLTPAERAALSACLLAGVLRALRAVPFIARVVVVSPDPAARALAATHGVDTLADPPTVRDAADAALNAALDTVGRQATAAGAPALLVLPADLPLVQPSDVAAVLAALPAAPTLVLVPTADGGTGALLRAPPTAVPACFGPDSAYRHLAAAREHGVRARLLWRPRLALDCDEPRDLLPLVEAPVSAELRALLAAWRVPARVSPAGGSR
ncbi:MAG TPA: 2-phospho-L-lactate guanylyltransferase [Chloroflexota bacterium]|jgi:2-phospho-L-lactate guanylyltransferase|nr:2-phospho-L-lactate guanylyltransferase [Chloroflexota bacterium]